MTLRSRQAWVLLACRNLAALIGSFEGLAIAAMQMLMAQRVGQRPDDCADSMFRLIASTDDCKVDKDTGESQGRDRSNTTMSKQEELPIAWQRAHTLKEGNEYNAKRNKERRESDKICCGSIIVTIGEVVVWSKEAKSP